MLLTNSCRAPSLTVQLALQLRGSTVPRAIAAVIKREGIAGLYGGVAVTTWAAGSASLSLIDTCTTTRSAVRAPHTFTLTLSHALSSLATLSHALSSLAMDHTFAAGNVALLCSQAQSASTYLSMSRVGWHDDA